MGFLGRVKGMLGVRGASHTSQTLRSTKLENVHRLQAQAVELLLFGLSIVF